MSDFYLTQTGEEYPPDYEEPLPYVFERHDRYTVAYTPYGKSAHLLHGKVPECGMDTWLDWLGTGTQREWEKAHELPLCKRCIKHVSMDDLRRDE